MESRCETVKSDQGFIDEKCTIIHEGKEYTSGGAWLAKRVDTGKYEGSVYVREKPNWNGCGNVPPIDWPQSTVGNWDGSIQIPCHLGHIFRSNMGDRRRGVWFRWNGIQFYGMWYSIDWGHLVYVKEIKG